MTFRGAKGGSSSFHQTPDNLRSNDTFEGVLGLCVGPIKGPTKGLKSITLNDTAIENETGESNFTDFLGIFGDGDPLKFPQAIELKLGAGSAPQSVGVQFSNTGSPVWVTKTLTSTNADYVDLRFIAQQLFRQDSKGIYNETATIEIQMKPVGSTTWINPTLNTPTSNYNEQGNEAPGFLGGLVRNLFPEQYYNFSGGVGSWKTGSSNYAISGKTNSAAVYELRIGLPNTGPYANTQWDIRARLLEVQSSDDGNGNTTQRNIQWESIAAVYSGSMMTHEDCRGVAWLQLYGKASDQLTGVPEVEGEYDTKIVSVPSSAIYNASTRVYTAGVWDGSWNKAFTTDPAWIINDAISDSLSGLSLVAQGSYMNKWDCLEASKWFSELVPDGDGGTHCRYSMNITVSQPQKGDEFIQYLAGACGGLAYDEGNGQWRMKVDKPDTPVDIFTLDNIENEFVYSHTDTDTQFNDIIGQFKNADMDYRDDAVRLYDNTAIAKNGRKPTTLALVGCTNRQEAMRRVKLRLRSTVNETRMVSFTTNRRGRNVDPLSLILVADGDLGDSAAKTTGRGNASGTVLTFRDPIFLSSGPSYDIVYSVPNPNYDPDRTTQPTSADWKKPTITKKARISTASSNFDNSRTSFTVISGDAFPTDLPADFSFAIDAVGLPTMPVTYRVMSVTPNEDGERIAITAINVDTGKWAAADGVTKEDTVFTDLRGAVPAPLPPLSGTVLSVARRLVDIGTQVTLTANWIRPSALMLSHFMIKWRVNGGAWTTEDRIFLPPFELSNPAAGIYDFEIYSVDRSGGASTPLTASLTVDATAVGEVLELAQDITALVSDSILSRNEKSAVMIDYQSIIDNYNALNAKYVTLGSPAGLTTVRGNASTALSALIAYLTGLSPAFNDTGTDTPIVPATYRAKWADAYNTLAIFTAAITGQPGATGVSAFTGYLTNEGHTVPADSSGNVTSYAGASGNFKVFYGTTDVTASCGFSNYANTQGFTGGIDSSGAYSITSGLDAGEENGTITFRAVHGTYGTVDKTFSLAKSKAGPNGASPALISLTTSLPQLRYDKTNTLVAGQSMTLNSTRQNTTDTPIFIFYDSLGSNVGAQSAGGWASAYPSIFSTSGPDNFVITANQVDAIMTAYGGTAGRFSVGVYLNSSPSIQDRVSTNKIKDGADGAAALTGYLTNEDVTLPALADGTVTSYAQSNGNFKVFLGTTDVTAGCTFALSANPQGLVGAEANSTYNATTGAYHVNGGFDAGEQTASLTLVATHTASGGTITKKFTLSKSLTGSNGASPPLMSLQSSSQVVRYDKNNAYLVGQSILFTANRQNGGSGVTVFLLTDYNDGGVLAGTPSYLAATWPTWFTASGADAVIMTDTGVSTLMAGYGGSIGHLTMTAYFDTLGYTGVRDRVGLNKITDGPTGETGLSSVVQGSANGTSWHLGLQTGDLYMRVSNNSGATYGATVLIKGEGGTPGVSDYTSFVFKRSPSTPSTPTDNTGDPPTGWTDTAPAGSDPVWMSKAEFRIGYGQLTSWSPPIRVDGTDGAQAWTANSLGGAYTRSGGSFTAIGNVNIQTVEKFPQARISCQVTGFNENTGLGFVDPTTGYPYEFILIGAWGSDVRKHHGGVVQVGTGVTPAAGQLWELVHQGTEIIGYINGVSVGVVATGVPADRALQGQFHMNAGVTLNNITFSRAGAAGASAASMTLGSYQLVFAANYTGTVKTSEVPKTVKATMTLGGTDVSASTTWTIDTETGCSGTTIGSSGLVTVNSVTNTGQVRVKGVYAGSTYYATFANTVNLDPAPPSTATSSSGSLVNIATGGADYISSPSAGIMTVKATAAGQVTVSMGATYSSPHGGATNNSALSGKFKYRVAGSGGSWSDLTSTVTGSAATWNPNGMGPGEPTFSDGSLSFTTTVASGTLTANALYEIVGVARNAGFADATSIYGTAGVSGA